ncbi:conserved hypothetical protein [Thiomonas sp. X19]|uniref:DUF5701 family protein n=1 Tax=Thiomonas sp. X19 TaxID=1050370 RepID=UPI000B681357|nr:DUF5701 family protein [Thiomonas sp. X19]SCC91748.1 conserved hypothetical protein [Thiomonas sp. X19]
MPHPIFTQQIDTLIRLRYPAMLGMTDRQFDETLAPLGQLIPPDRPEPDAAQGRVPFVLVINTPATSSAQMLDLVKRQGKQAIEKLYPKTLNDFSTIAGAGVPEGDAYLLRDIDRGDATRNVTPDAAYALIADAGRSPVTIHEGIALLTHYP